MNIKTGRCKYHSKDASTWFCGACSVDYCRKCIPGSLDNYDHNGPRCPVCNVNLDFLGASNTAKTFWKIPKKFFLYPFQTNTLIIIALCFFSGLLFSSHKPPFRIYLQGLFRDRQEGDLFGLSAPPAGIHSLPHPIPLACPGPTLFLPSRSR